jgi:diguanylate cyclase (GGDEF)-like protein
MRTKVNSTWPRRRLYPLIGVLLALGAPLGLTVLHAVQAGTAPTLGWLSSELRGHSGDYLYLTASTLLAFALCGWFLGDQEDRLKAGALSDPLTRLWNRRYLDDRLKQELKRAARHPCPLSFLLIDVDRLKDINDRAGHAAGDEALKVIAQAIGNSCRTTDVAARYGGDEFAVLAPSTCGLDAVGLAQRIRAALGESHVGSGPVSVSIGVADLTDAPSLEATELSRAADRALYRAKAEGRNRVARAVGAVASSTTSTATSSAGPPGR